MTDGITIGVVCSIGVGSERGGRACNEDNYLVCRGGEVRFRENDVEVVNKVDGVGVLLAIADGMGGHEDGAVASGAAVQALSRLYSRGWPSAPELALHQFVVGAHQRLHAQVAQRGAVRLGTTLTSAWLLGDRLFWIHVGDSRLYHFRGDTLTRLTPDHTRREFARRDRRRLPSDPDSLAQNFVYGSRGLGNDTAIRIDPGRDTGQVPLKVGDRLLLCSDGLSSFVDDFRIAAALREVPSPAACAEVLLERAIARGSRDNVTVMIARVNAFPDCVGIDVEGVSEEEDTIVPV